jgi:hypothetical protein
MSFFKFQSEDIVNIKISTTPSYLVERNGDQVTGSVYLEKQFLTTDLSQRYFLGFSEKEGGLVTKDGPFTSSLDFVTAVSGGTNKELYEAIENIYDYYSFLNANYRPYYTGSVSTTLRVIAIPEIYYDREILSGTFSASDKDSAGADRKLYDDGRGGIYSGSVSGTLVGHIFYPEGVVILTKSGLSDFGTASSTNFKWRAQFKGVHQIPTQIYRCRAPGGQLNASTNPTFYTVARSGSNKNEREVLMTGSVYVTEIGLFNEDYELVGIAKLAQPIKKEFSQDLLFRLRMDF